MATSINACPPAPPLTERLFRRRLETIHGRLLELEGRCPPGHAAALFDALDTIEAELASLGRSCPEAELTEHDKAVLAALGGAL